jgi:hypothetical protein
MRDRWQEPGLLAVWGTPLVLLLAAVLSEPKRTATASIRQRLQQSEYLRDSRASA